VTSLRTGHSGVWIPLGLWDSSQQSADGLCDPSSLPFNGYRGSLPQVQLATYLHAVTKLWMGEAKPLFPYMPSVSVHMYAINLRFQLYEGIRRETKGDYTLSVKLSDFNKWCHNWRKNWVNCAVYIGNSAGLRIVLSSRLSHTELCRSLRKSHSFLSLCFYPP